MMPTLKGMLPNSTVFEFLSEQELSQVENQDFNKRIRRMRRPAVSSFVVLAGTEVLANLTRVVSNDNPCCLVSFSLLHSTVLHLYFILSLFGFEIAISSEGEKKCSCRQVS